MSSTQLKKDLLGEGANRYNKIRHQARVVAFSHYPEKKCKCGYDKHVEVCHIKAIKDFDLHDPLSDINAVSNLELLCPNCHWEKDNLHIKRKFFCECGKQIRKTSKRCHKCASKEMVKSKYTPRPPKEKLIELTSLYPLTIIGKQLGVSGNAVKKWCKSYQIDLGNRRGYWAKARCK
jgi:hypothetical protein